MRQYNRSKPNATTKTTISKKSKFITIFFSWWAQLGSHGVIDRKASGRDEYESVALVQVKTKSDKING